MVIVVARSIRRRPPSVDLRDAGVVADQPQRRDLLLGQVEVDERLGEMAVDRAVGEADVEAEDIVEAAQLVGIRALSSVKVGASTSLYPRPKQLA